MRAKIKYENDGTNAVVEFYSIEMDRPDQFCSAIIITNFEGDKVQIMGAEENFDFILDTLLTDGFMDLTDYKARVFDDGVYDYNSDDDFCD